MKKFKLGWIFCGILLGACSALAENSPAAADLTQMSLEDLTKAEVVFAASKTEQKTTEAPASITIITSDKIKSYGYRTLDELLRSVRGFFITDDRDYTYIGLRGFGSLGGYNNRILLLVDGHRVNDAIYDACYTGENALVDLQMVDRVEIIRGPGSSLYGSSAFFGVINLITRPGAATDGLSLSAAGGSFDSLKGSFLYGGRTDSGLQWTAQGSLYDSGGSKDLYYPEYDAPSTHNGIAQNNDAEQSQHAYLSLSQGDWSLKGAFVNRRKIFPTGAYDTVFNDPDNYTNDQRGFVELAYKRETDDAGEFSGRLSLDMSNYYGNYILDGSGLVNHDYSNGAWWGGELQWTLPPIQDNKITLGAEWRHNFEQTQGDYDVATTLDDHRDSYLAAFYAQDEIRFASNLFLNLGGRFDYYSTFGGNAVPRAALIWEPIPNTHLKFLAGKAFRAPNPYELYYYASDLTSDEPTLKPETIQTYEIEWEQLFLKDHRFILSAFYYNAAGLIDLETNPLNGLPVYLNIDKASATGIEGEYQFKISSGLQGSVNYTLQRAQDDSTGLILSDSPQQLAKADLQIPLFENGLLFSGECQYSGKSSGYAGGTAAEYTVFNLKLYSSRFFADNLEMNLALYNLMDQRYYLPVSEGLRQETLQQDGRSVWARLACKL